MHTFHRTVWLITAAVCISLAAVAVSADQLAVKFSLDWKFEGPSAAYLLAVDKGYFADEGLDVTVDTGQGFAGGDSARRQRRLPVRLCRHQLADQVPRQESGGGHQGHSHGVRRVAVRDRHAGQDRHRDAEGPGRAHSRRAGSRTAPTRSGRRSSRRTASTPAR